jgi:hypothetical protein
MASTFPNSIDPFINPVYTKVNGVDYVKAEHVNDLQDAVRNIEMVIAGAGLSMNLGSNNYVPSTASVKVALEILDGAIKLRQDAFEDHLNFVMPTDPFQHHSNVVQVTAIGNLSSTRAQSAFEELQADIDAIMSGGYVEGFTLDDRYILKAGPAVVTGSLTVQNDFTALQNSFLGSSIAHQVVTSGDLSVGKNLLVNGDSEFGGDIVIPNTAKIGAKDFFEYTNIAFLASGMHLKSYQDFIFTLDSDDAIDGLSTIAKFEIKNGLGNTLFSVNEDGEMSVLSRVAASFAELDSHLIVGGAIQTRLEQNKMEVQDNVFTIKLDSDNTDPTASLIVTRDGDNGTTNTSTNIILKATDTELIAGNHSLKRGVTETGYFGLKFYSDDAGGKFQGYGVNFKSKMLSVPSSVSLSIDPTKSTNYNNVTITDLNEYGFFVECDALTVGHVELKGTYTTVGN